MKTIKKSIEINTPAGQVWDVLFQEKYSKIWYNEFSPGTYAETDWKLGSKVIFKNENGDGMVGKIVANTPNEILSIEFDGMVNKNIEDYESDDAKTTKGTHETYKLSTKGDTTLLNIEADMVEEYFDSMSTMWDNALQKIKELAEAK